MKTADPNTVLDEVLGLAFEPRERMDAAQWAERYREVHQGATPGPWSFSRSPYTRGMHLAWSDPAVRQVTIQKAEQVGGTEAQFNCLFWAIEQRPGPRLWIYPTIGVARNVNSRRLEPTMRACPRVARLLGHSRSDQTKLEIGFIDGSFIFFTGSNSDANVESFPYRDVLIDELDRCVPEIVGKTRGRRNAYPDAKLFVVSTPTHEGVGIDAEYTLSDQCRWWTPCPECERHHVRDDFAAVKWEHPAGKPFGGELAPEARKAFGDAVERGAWYECPSCGHAITPYEHLESSREGLWLPRGWEPVGKTGNGEWAMGNGEGGGGGAGAALPDHCPLPTAHSPPSDLLPAWCRKQLLGNAVAWKGEGGPPPPSSNAGFHLWGMMSTVVANPFGVVAREFVDRRGNPGREWVNRRLGRANRLRGERVENAELRKLCTPVAEGGYRMGQCPRGTLCLTAAMDIQADRAYVEIRGWGELGRDTSMVWCEEVPINAEAGDFRAIRAVLDMRFPMRDDPELSLPIGAVAIDSGKWTDHIYDLCGALTREGRPNVWPIKGDAGKDVLNPISEKIIGEVTGIARHKRNRHGMLVIKVNFFKQSLLTRIRGEETVIEHEHQGELDRGRFMLPEDAPTEYLLQLTSEERILEMVKGQPVHVFVPRPGYENKNHYWDAAGYNLALGIRAGVRSLTESAAERIRAQMRAASGGKALRPEQARRPGVMGRGRGILDRGR